MEEGLQCIPAKRGTATFLPAGKLIKIVNTSGTQVVVTWAFALPKPEEKKGDDSAPQQETAEKEESSGKQAAAPSSPKSAKKNNNRKSADLPSQQDAEKATREGLAQGEQSAEGSGKKGTTSSSWTGYLPSVPSVPSLGFGKSNKTDTDETSAATKASQDQQTKDSKTWSSYFAAGKGFSSYIPQQASDTVSQFAGYHARDNNKSYMAQLQDFSKTPVGAAGMAAISGGGYGSSLYAGYSAWNSKHADNIQAMEFLSLSHSRARSLHLIPQVNDTLVTNLREPILTLVEDTSPGTHDTLTAACDPNRFKQLGATDWEKHGSCAENLVLALKELNERAGLKGAKGVGADVSVNTVPAALNLFMNIAWDKDGALQFGKPKAKAGDYVRFYAERDVVVVMSACPQDMMGINGDEIQDAHFIVEDAEEPAKALKRMPPARKKSMPRKISSSQSPTSAGGTRNKAGTQPASPAPAKKTSTVGSQQAAEPRGSQPAKSAPSQVKKKPAQAAAEKPAQPAAASRPKKKPIPPAVAAAATTNGEAAAPVERKKPRKLNPKPQAAAEK